MYKVVRNMKPSVLAKAISDVFRVFNADQHGLVQKHSSVMFLEERR